MENNKNVYTTEELTEAMNILLKSASKEELAYLVVKYYIANNININIYE